MSKQSTAVWTADRKRAVAGAVTTALFVGGWAARRNLTHVADHRYNWMAANAMAFGGLANVMQRPFGPWMQAWNETCTDKYGVDLNEPAGHTNVDTAAYLGNCDGFAKQPELSRAPMSALTSLGFLVASTVAAVTDPILACASAALAAGSYAWHSTGQADTIHLDHFGCTLFALAVARALVASLGSRLDAAWVNVGFCITFTATVAFLEPDDASLWASFMLAVVLLTVVIVSVGELYMLVPNCALPGIVGLAFHERTHGLNGVASCTANLDDDQTADAIHATWHCCAVVLGVEAALATDKRVSPLSAALLLLLVSLHVPETTPYVLPGTLLFGSAVCAWRSRRATQQTYGSVPGADNAMYLAN